MRSRNFRILQTGEIQKKCTKCGKWKARDERDFGHDKSRQDGFSSYCKRCVVKKSAAYKKTERGKELDKLSRARNIERVRAYRKKIQPITNERDRIKRKTDPRYALNKRMHSLMWRGLKKNKGGRSWQELAGYSIDDLRAHIEKQFKNGMTWERFLAGEIHIDHKIPRAAFNFLNPDDLDFKRCWSIKNLRPLWAFDNISKGDRLDKPFQPSLAIGGR